MLCLSLHGVLYDKHVIHTNGQNQEGNDLATDHCKAHSHIGNEAHTRKDRGQDDDDSDDGECEP